MTSRGGGRGAARGGEFLNPCGAGWRPVDLPHKDLWPLITGARSLSSPDLTTRKRSGLTLSCCEKQQLEEDSMNLSTRDGRPAELLPHGYL